MLKYEIRTSPHAVQISDSQALFWSVVIIILKMASLNNLFLCSMGPTKCILFIIIHIFSTPFAIYLFYLHKLKTNTKYGTTTVLCRRTNSKQKKTSHDIFQLTPRSYCTGSMVSLKDGFTVWHQSQIILFLPYPSHPLQGGCHICVTPYMFVFLVCTVYL